MEDTKKMWSAAVGTASEKGPVSIRSLGDFRTKREAITAIRAEQKGKHSAIVRTGHHYFTIPAKR